MALCANHHPLHPQAPNDRPQAQTRHSRLRLPALLVFWCGLVGAPACGDDTPPPGADAGVPDTRLRILDTGDDLGLSYNERMTLRVRYENDLGEVLAGEPVEFSLVATGVEEDTVGSTLSLATAVTDSEGVASVDLVAGPENASFRVAVDARDAPTQFFFIEISDGGFARLRITPVHDGWRAMDGFSRIEVRLYRPSQVTCAELNIDEPPVSFSPVRSLDGFGGTVEYQNVAAGQPQIVVAWAQIGESNARSAYGCVDIGTGQLPTGTVEFAVVMSDRALRAEDAPVRTRFDLSDVVAYVRAVGADRSWRHLACPAGPGQLLLDCTLDALVADGNLDCRPEADSSLSMAIEARRGAKAADGCRPANDAGGEPALDQMVTDAVAAGGQFPIGESLATLLTARTEIAAGFILETRLSTLANNGTESALSHRLAVAEVVLTDGESSVIELFESSRPVVLQSPVASTWQGPHAVLSEHEFTLRYGQVAAQAFTELALQPAGVADRADTLGTLLADSVDDASTQGCEALSEIVCTDIGQSSQCLSAACAQGAAALDGRLTGWWRIMAADGSDFQMAGSLFAVDDDGDLAIETWSPPQAGTDPPWSANMTLLDGTVVPTSGTLDVEATVPP